MTQPDDVGFAVVPAAYVFPLRPAADGSGDEVLLQLRSGTGYRDGHWGAAAAGHVERGETAPEAARREAVEEIGVTDLVLALVTVMQRTAGGEPIDERVDFFFTASSWSGVPRVLEPDKCAGLRWCALAALDDLPEPVVPHERQVLEQLASGHVAALQSFGFTADQDHPNERGRR